MKIPKIAVIIGHTKDAPGAGSLWPLDEKREYDYCAELAIMVAYEILLMGGRPKIFSRDHGGINGAYTAVNQYGAKSCVELHFNAFNGNVTGTETLYTRNHRFSVDLAEMIQAGMVTALGRGDGDDRGIKHLTGGDRGYMNLSLARCPAVIAEPFFGDNLHDCTMMLKYEAEVAKGIAAGMMGFHAAKRRLL